MPELRLSLSETASKGWTTLGEKIPGRSKAAEASAVMMFFTVVTFIYHGGATAWCGTSKNC